MTAILVALLFAASVRAATKPVDYQAGYDAYKWYSTERNDSETFVLWNDDFYHNSDMSKTVRFDTLLTRQRWRSDTETERLKINLFHNYASSLRPLFNGSDSLPVVFHLNLVRVVRLEEVKQVLELAVRMEMTWLDERLTWNPDDFSGLAMLRVPASLIWRPDIVLYNNADDVDRGYNADDVRATISKNGEIYLGPHRKLRSSCILDLTLYPYDEQNCQLVFASWVYDSSQIKLAIRSSEVELSQYIDSAKWELIKSKIVLSKRQHNCCKAPFSDITVTFTLRRRFLFNNLFDLFTPTLLLTILCLMCFYLPPESGQKISLGITILLTFTLYTWMIAESTPRTSDFVPLITIYLTITMLLAAVVVALQVFILNVNGLTPILRPVPQWLRIIFIEKIAVLLGVKHAYKIKRDKKPDVASRQDYTGSTQRQRSSHTRKVSKENRRKASDCLDARRRLVNLWTCGDEYLISHADCEAFSRLPKDNLMDPHLDNYFRQMFELHSTSRLRFMAREARFFEQVERNIIGDNEEPCEPPEKRVSSADSPIWGPSRRSFLESKRNKNFITLIQSVSALAERERHVGLKREIASEWRLLAVVFDRMAFIFFFAFVIVSTFFILVWIPLTQEKYPDPKTGFKAPIKVS